MNQVCLLCLVTLHPYPHTLFLCPTSLRRQGPDQAALRLLDRFARDALQQARKEGYIKIATVLKDLADARTFWTANILVASIDTDCNDKSGWSPSLPFLTPSSFARHPSSSVPSLWHLPRGGLYIWGIKVAVDESSRHNSSCVNNSQSFNPNYRSSTEVPVVQPHIIPIITVLWVNS